RLTLGWRDDGLTDSISSWSINWGDGHTETTNGDVNSVAHSFDFDHSLASQAFTVSAIAHGTDGDLAATPLSVSVQDRAPLIFPWPEPSPPMLINPDGASGGPIGGSTGHATADTDPDGDSFSYASVTADHGTISLYNNNRSFSFVPDEGYAGPVTIRYS